MQLKSHSGHDCRDDSTVDTCRSNRGAVVRVRRAVVRVRRAVVRVRRAVVRVRRAVVRVRRAVVDVFVTDEYQSTLLGRGGTLGSNHGN